MVSEIRDSKEYGDLKKRIASYYPYFDKNALDSGRFLFGTDNPEVEFYDGDKYIREFLDEREFETWEERKDEIGEGNRNNHMSRYAGRVIKRFGIQKRPMNYFLKKLINAILHFLKVS
jgi:putative DNA primase/helicase